MTTPKKNSKHFSEQSERIVEAGKKGQGAIKGNLKRDAGRAAEAEYRSNNPRSSIDNS